MWKLLQKRTYDLLSHRYGLLLIIGGLIVITVSAFHFGEALLEWSHEKYAAVFNSYSDNLSGRSFRERLCLPVPIDVVYTWVNGSDPQLILQLRQVKMSMEEQLNITRPGQCTYSNCVPAPVLVLNGLAYTTDNLQALKAVFTLNDTYAFNYTSVVPTGKVDSMALVLPSWKEAKSLNGQIFQKANRNYSLTQAHYTSDPTLPHGAVMSDKVLMTGFPGEYSSDNVLSVLPDDHKKSVLRVEVHSEKGVAVLHMSGSKEADSILKLVNFTIEGKHPAFTAAYMVSDLTDMSRDGDVANSRFEDNEELRYSLRSLERFTPWVRHVYIVTNGQIPYWLSLDSHRISIVTHEDIFPNKSHLPTFSSPSIEAHLHRIPGLSDKFLYLNDDVMFGSDVWPDDFYSHSTGQKLYLTWPVPSCNEGCPSNWIRDGYCDKACNTSECEWDGGDCTAGASGHVQLGAGFQAVFGHNSQSSEDYCHAGCANNWLADKYCDQACNHLACGFDAGDCGVNNYGQLSQLDPRKETDKEQHYTVPPGETLAYFNLTKVVGPNGKITSASYKEAKAVRSAAVSNKFKVLTLVLYPNRNASTLQFYLQGYRIGASDNFQLNFTVSVNSSSESIDAFKKLKEGKVFNASQPENKEEGEIEPEQIVVFEEYPKSVLVPNADTLDTKKTAGLVRFPFNVTSSNLTSLGLSPLLYKELSQLVKDRSEGDFTDEGFQLALSDVYMQFQEELKAWKPSMIIQPVLPEDKDNNQGLTGGRHIAEKGTNVQIELELGTFAEKPLHRKLLASKETDVMDISPHYDPKTVISDVLVEQEPDQKTNKENNFIDNNRNRLVDMAILDEQLEPGVVEIKTVKAGHLYLGEMSKEFTVLGGESLEAKPVDGKMKSLMTDEEFLEFLKAHGGRMTAVGGLPWEVQGMFSQLEKRQTELRQAKVYEIDNQKGRKMFDTFGDSLRHVNRLYNKLFGYAARKVPAHMPHLIDKHAMAELQDIFSVEWDVTSSHKVRSPDDMQFAFSYYYYLLGAVVLVDEGLLFDEIDTDHSGILSDRELRTFATRMNDLPLYLETLTGMESMFINCSKRLRPEMRQKYQQQILALPTELYYEHQMPQVTKLLFTNCDTNVRLIHEKLKPKNKYKTSITDDSEVAFKMLLGNVSKVVGQLDDIRKNPKKFICLNDNIEHGTEEAKTVKAVVQDFYESLLPIPSQFELPRDYRNRFLHVKDLSEWKVYRDWLRFWAHLALIFLVLFTVASYFGDKIETLHRRLSRRLRRKSDSISPTDCVDNDNDQEPHPPDISPRLLSV